MPGARTGVAAPVLITAVPGLSLKVVLAAPTSPLGLLDVGRRASAILWHCVFPALEVRMETTHQQQQLIKLPLLPLCGLLPTSVGHGTSPEHLPPARTQSPGARTGGWGGVLASASAVCR